MRAILVEKNQEAGATFSYFLKTEKDIKYLPGQYIYLTLPKLNHPDPRGATRQFTISSSPTEGSYIAITTRARKESGFKNTLNELPLGSSVEINGPNGEFVFYDNDKGPYIFLAGGIGITPFRSIIKYVVDKHLNTKITLIYSNSLSSQIAFKEELENLCKANQNIKMVITITDPHETKWQGEKRRIDADLILAHVKKETIPSSTFWICGSPAMVSAMEEVVKNLGVNSKQILVDKFTGY